MESILSDEETLELIELLISCDQNSGKTDSIDLTLSLMESWG